MWSINAVCAVWNQSCTLVQYAAPLLSLCARSSCSLQQQLSNRHAETCIDSSSSSTATSQQAARHAAWNLWNVPALLPVARTQPAPAAAGFNTIASRSCYMSSTAIEGARHTSSAVSSHSLEACLALMQHIASPSNISNTCSAIPDQDFLQYFEKHQKNETDIWVYIKCGEWEDHPQGWTGPALALLQLWPVVTFQGEPDVFDYMLWELDSLSVPTGRAYTSTSALEGLTNRKSYRHASDSITVLQLPAPIPPGVHTSPRLGPPCMRLVNDKLVTGVRLRTWLRRELGVERTMRKAFSSHKITYTPNESTIQPMSWGGMSGAKEPSKKTLLSKKKGGQKTRGLPVISKPRPLTGAAGAIAAATSKWVDPEYVYPVAPEIQSTQLHMGESELLGRESLIASILSGNHDLSRSHIPLSVFLPEHHTVPAHTGHIATAGAVSTEASSRQAWQLQQVFRIEDLERRAMVAEAAQQQGQDVDSSVMPAVPDATRPFTITMTNGRDGQEYVVAHYEPCALQEEQQVLAAQLCTVFNNRSRQQKLQRTSAAPQELMVMSGMRVPIKGGPSARYGRYHGDTDPESDGFAATAWPYLRTYGRFPAVSRFWTVQLATEVQRQNHKAARTAGNRHSQRLDSVNYPSPFLWGSPFTSLGITHNYHSKLHCEPGEHPFSFITWQDLLCPGSRMKVGFFWLTGGLAFLPQPGSALYIDVRLVTHRSESCVVTNRQFAEEGRYGCALFIKPRVLKRNAQLWAEFDAELQKKQVERSMELMRLKEQQTQQLLIEAGVSYSTTNGEATASSDEEAASHQVMAAVGRWG